jgi:hypothetical protein
MPTKTIIFFYNGKGNVILYIDIKLQLYLLADIGHRKIPKITISVQKLWSWLCRLP